MVAPRGRGGGCSIGGGCGGRSGHAQCSYCKRVGHAKENCYSFHGFRDKVVHVSKSENLESKISDEGYQEFLRYNSRKSINRGQSSLTPSVSTACISQFVEGHSPWIIDLGALDHMSIDISSFSSISSSKFDHLVTVAN